MRREKPKERELRGPEYRGGLLEEPGRTSSGQRAYPEDAVRRVRFIKRAQEIGFSLTEIEELLPLRDDTAASSGEVLTATKAKIDDINRKLRDLRRMKRALVILASTCAQLDSAPSWRRWTMRRGGEHMKKRTVEVFTAGCPVCDDTVKLVQSIACQSCDVQILDMHSDKAAQTKAKKYRISRVPAIVVDGKLADCCQQGGVDVSALRRAWASEQPRRSGKHSMMSLELTIAPAWRGLDKSPRRRVAARRSPDPHCERPD